MVTYPDDWIETTIGKCVQIHQGGTPRTTDATFWNGNIVWLTPGEVTKNDGLFIDNSERKITENGLEHSSAELLPVGTILLCTRATIGDLAIAAIPLATNQGFKNLVCEEGIDNIFFSYLLHTCKEEMIAKAIGTTFLEISKKELSKIEICIPYLKEQIAIGHALRCFDTYIDDLAELIEKKRGIRDGALEDLIVGRTRIAGYCGERKAHTISDITRTVITGGTPSTARQEYYGGNIPWLSSTEIHQKRIKKPTTYITDLGLQNSSAKMAPERAVLIALAGQGKTRGTAAYLTRPMTLNQSLAALVTNEKCNPEFLYYLIESMYLSLRELSSGDGGRGGLNKKLIKGLTVTIPIDVSEQEAIAYTLTAMDDEIEALETERDKMIQIREGAMDDLLTGRVRLRV